MTLAVKGWRLRLSDEWCMCLRSDAGCDIAHGADLVAGRCQVNNAKPILNFPSMRALAAHLGVHEVNVAKRVKRLRASNVPVTLEALRSPRAGRPRNEALDAKLHEDALFAKLMEVAPVGLEAIAEAYGVSVELVRLIERNALARLRVSRELLEVAS